MAIKNNLALQVDATISTEDLYQSLYKMWDHFTGEMEKAAGTSKTMWDYMGELGKGFGNDVNETMKSVFEDAFAGHMNTAAAYASKLKDSVLKSFADMVAGWASAQVTQTILDGMSSLWKSLSDTTMAAADGAAAGAAFAASYNAAVATGTAGGGAGAATAAAGPAGATGAASVGAGQMLGAGAMVAGSAALAFQGASSGNLLETAGGIFLNPVGGTIGAVAGFFGGGKQSISDAAHSAAVSAAQQAVRAATSAQDAQMKLIAAGLKWFNQNPQWGNIDEAFGNAAENGFAGLFPGTSLFSGVPRTGTGGAMNPSDLTAFMAMPHFAAGGIVTQPTIALIGEAGPEAVVPLSGPNAPNAGNGQPTIVKLILNGRELASILLDMSRTGQLKLDTSALITVGSV